MTENANSHATGGPLTLAVIIGSTRQDRFCPVPATWFAAEANTYDDLTVDVIDLADVALSNTLTHSGDVASLAGRLADADAFVVVTPEYNHSYPSSLKVAIDHYAREWQAKPVGFVSYGGMGGGLRAVEHLRQVFAELHATTVRSTISFHNFWERFDDAGVPHDAESATTAARGMLDQLAWWGHALRDARATRPYAA